MKRAEFTTSFSE